MNVYRYTSMHHPSGKTFNNLCVATSELEFLKQLSQWSAQQPKTWGYYAPVLSYVRPATEQDRAEIEDRAWAGNVWTLKEKESAT